MPRARLAVLNQSSVAVSLSYQKQKTKNRKRKEREGREKRVRGEKEEEKDTSEELLLRGDVPPFPPMSLLCLRTTPSSEAPPKLLLCRRKCSFTCCTCPGTGDCEWTARGLDDA